jgi:hypothetical protein
MNLLEPARRLTSREAANQVEAAGDEEDLQEVAELAKYGFAAVSNDLLGYLAPSKPVGMDPAHLWS